MRDEFTEITRPLVDALWKQGYFTIPLPRGKRKEFKLDLPAFERFDVVAFRWEDEEPEIIAVESKKDPEKGVPQARTYQLCIPKVYVASRNKPKDYQEFFKHGVGLILVQDSQPRIEIEARTSFLFNREFYRRSVLPMIKTIQAFYEFMYEILLLKYPPKERREKILNQIDFGVRIDYLWVSDRKSTAGIQWSVVCGEEMIRFGVNLESVKATTDAFGNKNKDEVEEIFDYIRKDLPKDFILHFEQRGKPEKRFYPGQPHEPFPELGKNRFTLSELTGENFEFMIREVMRNRLLEFGVWGILARGEEIFSISKNELYQKMKEIKRKYLEQLYERLGSR
ncbi:MAG: hypothetical protein QW704_03000 [Candidatus Hadarchaeales archaeon]